MFSNETKNAYGYEYHSSDEKGIFRKLLEDSFFSLLKILKDFAPYLALFVFAIVLFGLLYGLPWLINR